MVVEFFRNAHPVFSAVIAIIGVISLGINVYKFWKEYRVRNVLSGDEDELWHYRRAWPPRGHQPALANTSTRIITVANLKGGVGKTTLAANMAAYFDGRGKRVLVVDADYQGSISGVLLAAAGIQEVTSKTETLLAADASEDELKGALTHLQPKLANTWLVPAFYSLSRQENRHMIQWVMSGGGDVRYRLIEVFMRSPVLKQAAQDKGFDVVIIDAPPRLTTGTVNALCASTHLLVPTALTPVAARAVGPFLKMVRDIKLELNQELKLAGVVPTLTSPDGSLAGAEQQMIGGRLTDALGVWGGDGYIFKRSIPRRKSLSTAETEGMGYLTDDDAVMPIRTVLDEFGKELTGRIGLP